MATNTLRQVDSYLKIDAATLQVEDKYGKLNDLTLDDVSMTIFTEAPKGWATKPSASKDSAVQFEVAEPQVKLNDALPAPATEPTNNSVAGDRVTPQAIRNIVAGYAEKLKNKVVSQK